MTTCELRYVGGHQYTAEVRDEHGAYLDGARAEDWRELVAWAAARYPDARPNYIDMLKEGA